MVFTDRQTKIFEILQGLDPKIGDSFKGGIDALDGNNSDRMVHSAHSLREVIYMLSRLDEIKKFGRVRSASHGKTRKQDLIKNLDPIKNAPEEVYILYADLNDKSYWFAIVAHHSEFPSERKFRKKVEELEIFLIEKIFKPHFDVINEIDHILSTKIPSKKIFERIKDLISRDSSAYNHFFQNANVKWLLFLKSKYLKNPKHLIEIDGERKFPNWSPSRYLQKAASVKPKDVSQIILGFKTPEEYQDRNPWLLESFVKSAIEMPSKYGKLFVKKIYKEKWLHSPYHNYLDQPIADLMLKLAESGYEEETTQLIKILLDVKLGEPYVTGGMFEEYKTIQDVKSIVDNFWYEELLKNKIPIVFKKFPKSTINVLTDLITKTIYLENFGKGDKNSKTDASIGWRPAIEDHEQNNGFHFQSKLLGTLGTFLIELGTKSIPSLKKILKNISKIKYPAFRRLELYVYWTYPKYFKKEIDYSIERCFDKYELHHEYFHLLQNTFSYASIKTKNKYFSYVEKGPDKKHIELYKQQAKQQKDGFMDLKIKLWKTDKLKPILQHLTNKERKRFKDVVSEKEEEFPYPDFHSYSSGAVMSEPVSQLQDNLTPEQVFDFIQNYKTKELDFGHHDGTPEVFQNLVQNNSENYSKLALKCMDLNSIFIYRFFRGIEEAVKQKKTILWKPILSLSEKIIKSIKEGKYGESKEFDILNSIISALEDGIGFNSIKFTFRKRIWELLEEFVILQNDEPLWEESYPREDWDAFGISINTTNGKTFHAILKYIIWCEKNLNKKRVFVPEAKKLLTNYFQQNIPSTISRQAVLGYYLTTLYYYDESWIRSNISDLFKNKNEIFSRAVWDGYLIGKVYSSVFKDLIKQYNIHIKRLDSPHFKDDRLWDYDEHVIQHITSAYLFKIKESEKLFLYMLNHSHEKVVSHCAWYIGTILRHYKGNLGKSFDMNAFKKLWKNSKLTSNEELRTWVEFSPFNKNETLNLLYNSLKKSKKSIRFLSFLVDELESYAKTHPQSTLKCLDLLIRKRANDPEFHIAREKLKILLEILLKNKKSQTKTISLIHYLGELGHNDYKILLDKIYSKIE